MFSLRWRPCAAVTRVGSIPLSAARGLGAAPSIVADAEHFYETKVVAEVVTVNQMADWWFKEENSISRNEEGWRLRQ